MFRPLCSSWLLFLINRYCVLCVLQVLGNRSNPYNLSDFCLNIARIVHDVSDLHQRAVELLVQRRPHLLVLAQVGQQFLLPPQSGLDGLLVLVDVVDLLGEERCT